MLQKEAKINGANLQIWQYTGVGQEKFFMYYTDGYYYITAAHSNKVLDVTNDNNIVQNEKIASDDTQRWSVIPDGMVHIILYVRLMDYSWI